MGNVYLAEDEELQRHVAVKVPCRNIFASDDDLTSMRSEARTVARLEHPAIVPVYDLGREPDGTCYIVMKYIEGQSLAERLKSGRWSPARPRMDGPNRRSNRPCPSSRICASRSQAAEHPLGQGRAAARGRFRPSLARQRPAADGGRPLRHAPLHGPRAGPR